MNELTAAPLQFEHKIQADVVRSIRIEDGAVTLTTLEEVRNFAYLMASMGAAIPKHLQGNPSACLGVVLMAVKWGIDPMIVANKSYIAKDGQPIAYESQLIHAVVEKNAPLSRRLRAEYVGMGDQMICRVIGYIKGEDEPFVYESEPLGRLRPRTNSQGNIAGSPLWARKPKVQMFYDATRDWARMYVPDVIGGVYDPFEKIEMEAMEPAVPPKTINPLIDPDPVAIESKPAVPMDILTQCEAALEEVASIEALDALGRDLLSQAPDAQTASTLQAMLDERARLIAEGEP